MPVNLTQIELLRKLLRHGARDRVVRILEKFRAADFADIFKHLSPPEQRQFIEVLYSQKQAAETLLELPEGILADMLGLLDDERVATLIERVASDDGAYFIAQLDEDRVNAVLEELDAVVRERIEHILVYPAESAGAMMTSQMLTLDENMTVEEAIESIRERSAESEFIFYVYVINEDHTFMGVVPIRRLITSQARTPLKELMVVNPIAVKATDDQEQVADVTARYNLLAVPVVDEKFTLVGVITVDDVIDVLQSEATEDMYLMQLLSEEDRVYSPVSTSVKKRFPWMVLNLGTAFLAASVISLFEDSITQVVVLASLMPVVAGMGGNGGTQTLTVITRGIALGELEYSDGFKAIWKQVAVGLIVGAGVGLLAAAAAFIWKGNPYLGLVLFLAMISNLAIAGFAGAAVPIVLKALNQDPAMGGGVVVTTFTDICGFMVFLGLATLFLAHL